MPSKFSIVRSAVATLAALLCLSLCVGLLAGCAMFKPKPVEPEDLFVAELRRSVDCGTTGREARLRYFASADAYAQWQATQSERSNLMPSDKLPADKALLLVEMGQRNSGGHYLKVSESAYLDRDRMLWLTGEWTAPGPDRMVTQMITSPCVLVAIPARAYKGFRISDQDEELRASLTLND